MHVMGSVSPANERGGFAFQEGFASVVPTPSPPSSRFSDIKSTQTPPPPPPPLPPPPPPPLPPLLPGLGDLRKKKRVRSFFWKTIPEEQVKGRTNLWTQGRVQQQYQIDVQTIEELFGQNDSQSNTKAAVTRGKNRSSFRETKEEVSILDSKRGMNIGIFLKQFKKSNQMIIDDIRDGNSKSYGAETLRELLKLLPDSEEVKKLKAYRGDVSKLSLPDSFVYQLILLPSYVVRIESMLLKEEFPGACEAMTRDITILRCATKELMGCEELHAVLHLVLQAGNILNAGGYAGNAVGFKLSSLLSLADTKANKPGMNLLHFVALEAQKKDEKLLEFPLKLTHIQAAARISLETLDSDLQWLTTRTRSVEESVQRDTELLQQLDSFLQHATSSLCSLRHSQQQLKKEGSELIDFFCEDRDTFRLDDCFRIFYTFCSRFTAAVKENIERESKEAARRRRLQQLEEQKRHSWAGGEEVAGAFKYRCSSENDMSQHDEAGLLMKSHRRSPLDNPQSPPGRWGSLRRSRHSPSKSPSIAAERELSMFLEIASRDRKVAQQRGGGEARTALPKASREHPPQTQAQSPMVTTCSFPQNQQPQMGEMAPQTSSSPPKTSLSLKNTNSHKTTTSYLSYDAAQMPVDVMNTTNEVTVKPTSDLNQQFDHNNNGKNEPDLVFSMLSDHQSPSSTMNKSDLDFEHRTAATGAMSVVLEKCTLVPELKVFSKVPQTSLNKVHHTSHLHGNDQDDIVITDLEEEGVDKSSIQKTQTNSHSSSSLSQKEEDKGRAEKVVVWCVTGVCEAAGEPGNAGDTHMQTEKDQCRSDNQGGNQQASSVAANCTPSEPEPVNEKQVPVPISSQPVPVSRCDDLSLQVSSPGWCPTKPDSANEAPAFTTDASDEGKLEEKDHGEGEDSTSEIKDVETFMEQSTNHQSQNKAASCHEENTGSASSVDAKAKLSTSPKPSAKNLRTTKTPTGMKPSTINGTSATNKSKPVRTLNSSESQGMRRVVPISRIGRAVSSLGKRPENSPGRHQGSSTTLTMSSLNSNSLRQRERPSTAPSSRRSSLQKTLDPKDSKDLKVAGIWASAREQNKEFQNRPPVRKASIKPKPQPEEKMCRSTLRALTLAGEGGGGGGRGGGSISAPATPLHKGTTHPSSPLPGFARSTASSSFRKTHTILIPPGPPHTDSSPKSSPKKTTSPAVPQPGTSPPFMRTGSLRASNTSRSLDVLNSSSPLKKSQSIRVGPSSPLHNSVAPPKGHRRNDSGSFSDKSTHSRDSGKTTRPSWR
ncbi:FH2 domain-containing protein 1-like [Anabas testudineus]|uniref:FH2 domain-containing protein n=1 Tax=Anabas testudineus TaxID=64144 RepID=A0A3Q1J3K9_ANATE|nr:FH2 domain-containing protein 1-like [Anabas testudineus]